MMELTDSVVLVFGIVDRGVDTDLDPGKQTVGDVVAEVHVLRDGVERGIGLEDRPHVFIVGGEFHGVGVVRVRLLDLGAQVLGPEELADVADGCVPVSRISSR